MKLLLVGVVMFAMLGSAFAEETLKEKGEAAANTAVRVVNKGVNRTQEALCGALTGDSKLQCLAKKTKNRIVENKDAVVDKVKEEKNKIDAD